MGLSQQACVKKTVLGLETHLHSSKEKVLGAAVSKGYADSLLEHERPITIDSPWKRGKL